MNKKLIGGILVVVILLVGGLAYLGYSRSQHTAGSESNFGSLFLTPQTAWNDIYTLAFGTSPYSAPTRTLIDLNGVYVGPGAIGGSGFTTFSTSTALTGAQLIKVNQQWLNTTAVATATLPSATSTYIAFGSPNIGEAFDNVFKVTNDSTNTVNYVAGTGVVFKLETQGIGTSTVIGGGSASQISVLASSTAYASIYWDSASSTEIIEWGNNYH